MVKFTLEHVTHFRILIVRLFVIASKNENLFLIQGGPSTAAKQTELSFNLFDCRINFAPKIRDDTIDLDVLAIFAFLINSAQLH